MKAIDVIITARNRVRAPSRAASLDAHPPLALVAREFDDEDAVLGRQRDQYHESDLGIEVERQSGDKDSRIGAKHATTTESRTGIGIIQLS